ncbi:MAG: S9 family peptidase [Saprospiraceae bacterium]|nr:S9 family peptidase [Saprospiraceae bacterium]
MKKEIFVFLSLFLVSPQIFSQKPLDEAAYFNWKAIQNRQLSDDGQWLIYQLAPNKGDKRLVVTNCNSMQSHTIERGENAYFDDLNQKLVCIVKPAEELVDSLKRKKVKEEEMPIDSLLIMDLAHGSKTIIPNVKSVKYPDEWNGWIFYQLEPDRDSLLKKSLARELKKEESVYVSYRLRDGFQDTLEFVKALILAASQPIICVNQNIADSIPGSIINRYDLTRYAPHEIFSTDETVKKLNTSRTGDQLAWLVELDSAKDQISDFELYYWVNAQGASKVADNQHQQIPDEWIISENYQPRFSPEGKRIFFGAAPVPLLPDTALLSDEKVEVEIWNYRDQVLYTQQEVQEKSEKNRTFLFAYDIDEHSIAQLGSMIVPQVDVHDEHELDWAIGYDDLSMQKYLSWEGRIYKDLYLISLLDGEKMLIKSKITGNPRWSPGGSYIYWYEEPDTTWYAYSIEEEQMVNLSGNDPKFSDELNDRPDYPSSYGMAGWSEGDDEIYLYDRFDIWAINPNVPEKLSRVTRGRESNTQFRYLKLDPEEEHLPDVLFLKGFNENTKNESYTQADPETGKMETLLDGAFHLDDHPTKSKDANKLIFTKETFQDFPDLYLADNGDFQQAIKMTDANPQQSEYLWGTIELLKWNAPDGHSLEGLLVKPGNFDPAKKYPMIVNFYERSSDGLYTHRAPFPHRSTINYAYYASNGYVIFNPNIEYKIGYPGESAYDAVVSGTQAVIDMGFVDADRVGLQGHSWGGYQIAHIITKTDMFACAESGAPVVNMVSAYGGIRWGSGMSRMFQYEHTQSRLGATLWERPDLYLENSPIFNLDKVSTPVLILHNDEDSAVPWYQGIEFFVAMRRLNKPAWLLNYNGEPHWPLKWQNRLDFNRRLFQFFEHYLKQAPMPVWMKEGIPAIEKGINTGLELSEEK